MTQPELKNVIKEIVNEESSKSLDALQLALDIAGIPPSIGTPVNGANTTISLLRAASDKEPDARKKHLIDAGLNAVSMIPFASVVKLVKLRALRKPAVMAARSIKGGVRTTPRSYEPSSAMEEGAGWGTTKDIKKDPKHIDDPKTGKMERWRIKFDSSRDLKKHGNTEKSSVNENVTPKTDAFIEKNMKEIGTRQTAKKIIDLILSDSLMGLTSEDLPDTSTFANGLDDMETALTTGNYKAAIRIAKETAKSMVEEEGGTGIMNENTVTKMELKRIIKELVNEMWVA